jgi:carbamoyltransferase
MSYVIGVSAYYHDSSACLFKGGNLLFACEEEKFTGIKHDSSFPINTLNYIFKKYRISKKDVETICYYENPNLKMDRVLSNIKPQIFKNPLYVLNSYFKIKKNIKNLNELLLTYSNNVFYSEHHLSHQYYSFFTSHFDNSVILSIDGVGEFDTMSMGIGKSNGIDYMSMATYPHSIGLYYSAMTSFLGFKPNEGEYKVMGLSSYGDPKKYIEKVRKLITYKNTKLECNLDVFCWNKSNKTMFNDKLSELLGLQQRLPDEEIKIEHKDLAASIQLRYEEILFEVIKSISIISDNSNLCLGGGCAYNGLANGKIIKNSHFNNLWIPPAPSDAGSSIGACLHYLVGNKELKNKVTKNPFLGPDFTYNELVKSLKGVKYHKFSSEMKLNKNVAKKLKDGKIVAWFQGRIEFGSRALGNRSILANPTIEGMKNRINNLVKKRETFRPFAPMVLKEYQNTYFDMSGDIPYMNQVVEVKPEFRDTFPAITHVDGTARVQTVYKHTLVHNLLKEYEEITGYPILLNTSFNVKDKTMVLTPKDAIKTFNETDIDILVIGNYLIYK